MAIPKEIINLVTEATSSHNDGWVKRGSLDKLIEIRDYLNGVIERELNKRKGSNTNINFDRKEENK